MNPQHNTTAAPDAALQPELLQDLHDWSCLTGQPLPYPAATIVWLEAHGFVVDLVDGSATLSMSGAVQNERIAATAAGLALVREVTP